MDSDSNLCLCGPTLHKTRTRYEQNQNPNHNNRRLHFLFHNRQPLHLRQSRPNLTARHRQWSLPLRWMGWLYRF